MICPVCASQIQDGLRFCPACNADLSAMVQQQPAPQQMYSYQPRRRAQMVRPEQPAPTITTACPYCGRPLQPGETCPCQMSASVRMSMMGQSGAQQSMGFSGTMPPVQQPPVPSRANRNDPLGSVKGFFSGLKERLGFGRPEALAQDPYESQLRIVPDAVAPAEGEAPIRQYDLCTLRSRFLMVPIASAQGRLQITNQRVILRAPGRGVTGRAVSQQEFDLGEVAGMEASRCSCAHWGDLPGLLLLSLLVGAALFLLSTLVLRTLPWLVILLAELACVAVYVFVHKQWLVKAFTCLGTALACLALATQNNGTLYLLPMIIMLVPGVCASVFYLIRPELQLSLRTRMGNEVILLRRGSARHAGSGYQEILADDDIYNVIREAMAVIRDVQMLGNQGAEKWYRP